MKCNRYEECYSFRKGIIQWCGNYNIHAVKFKSCFMPLHKKVQQVIERRMNIK